MASFAGPRMIQDSSYNYHICTTSGVFMPSFSGNVEVMVVAGGGGGGMDMGGGGGGGGYLTSASYAVTAGTGVTVTVGAGGVGGPSGGTAGNNINHQYWISATQGGNSVFGSLTAIGGGYGGSSYVGYTPNYGNGGAGGSGGGSTGYVGNGSTYGAGTAGQGNRGGTGATYYSGGGGGAGAQGTDAASAAHGGIGILNAILGPSYYWAGGGGGAGYSSGQGGNGGAGGGGGGANGFATGGSGLNTGDNGGGGRGGTQSNCHGGHAGMNTGGGGGGGAHYNRNNYGGNGGSGIVVIRYLKTLGTSTFGTSSNVNKNSLVFSFDAGNPKKGSSVEVLVVAGGGGGGQDMGGGGGAGGLVYNQAYQTSIGTAISVIIGGGGAGASGYYGNYPPAGASGSNTTFGTITAIGGGGGGSGHYYPVPYCGQQGQSGGSGGGDSPLWGRNRAEGNGSGVRGQGYDGGLAEFGDANYLAGGGGGAAQSGGGGGNTYSGNGGQGYLSSIDGTSRYWAGGGGGSTHSSTAGDGGAGGGGGGAAYAGYTAGAGGAGLNAGGAGASAVNGTGGNGGANTGGGGGGGSHYASVGGAGGSGIVVVRYSGSARATGGTIATSGGYTTHIFTSSGTFTPTDFLDPKDQSEYGNKMTLVNGPTYSSLNGGSLVFNGSNQWADINNMSLLAGTTAFTISAFYNCTTQGVIIGNYGGGYSTNSIWFYSGGLYLNNGSLYIPSAATRTLGKHHLCVTRSVTGYCNAYLDGVLEVANVLNAASIPANINWRIAADVATNGECFGGNLYSVQVYNRELSAAEVKQNYNSTRSRYQITGWMKPSTVFASGRLSDNLQIWTSESSPAQYYSSVILNRVLTGDFTVVASWAHDYIGCGMVYKNAAALSDFTGYSADGNGPYFGAINTCGIASGTGYTYFGQYHAPLQGSGGSKPLYYFKWQRSGNALTLQYSTTSAAGPWTNFTNSSSTTCASTDQVIIGCGEASTSEDYPLTLLYIDIR